MLAFAAIVNLIFTCINYRHSKNVAIDAKDNRDKIQALDARHKKRVIRLEEFRTLVRDPVRSTLSDIQRLAKSFAALANTHIPLDEHRDDLRRLNSETASALGSVYDSLADANNSQFADGTDWADGIEDAQDHILAQLNTALDEKKPQIKRLSAVSIIAKEMHTLRSNVNSRLETALHTFADDVEFVRTDVK